MHKVDHCGPGQPVLRCARRYLWAIRQSSVPVRLRFAHRCRNSVELRLFLVLPTSSPLAFFIHPTIHASRNVGFRQPERRLSPDVPPHRSAPSESALGRIPRFLSTSCFYSPSKIHVFAVRYRAEPMINKLINRKSLLMHEGVASPDLLSDPSRCWMDRLVWDHYAPPPRIVQGQ